jgi:hypothetical protein
MPVRCRRPPTPGPHGQFPAGAPAARGVPCAWPLPGVHGRGGPGGPSGPFRLRAGVIHGRPCRGGGLEGPPGARRFPVCIPPLRPGRIPPGRRSARPSGTFAVSRTDGRHRAGTFPGIGTGGLGSGAPHGASRRFPCRGPARGAFQGFSGAPPAGTRPDGEFSGPADPGRGSAFRRAERVSGTASRLRPGGRLPAGHVVPHPARGRLPAVSWPGPRPRFAGPSLFRAPDGRT